MQITPVVKQLLILNVIFFLGAQAVAPAYDFLSLHYIQSDQFQLWQPFTYQFMHAAFPRIEHIVFNMFGLYMFGSTLEQLWGPKKFLFFYISCGLGAALVNTGYVYFEVHQFLSQASDLALSSDQVHKILNFDFVRDNAYRGELFEASLRNVLDASQQSRINEESFGALFHAAATSQTTMVGASGAIYGLLVAFAFMFPNAEMMMIFLPIPIKAKFFVPGILLIDIFSGISSSSVIGGPSSGIAHFAHIGGALFGFLMMWYWKKNSFNDNRWN
ncbi:rhomboid family intramembrane serine protease [Flavobacterium sp. D33]|nr:rhomboid family intramembrane serine protease [Flavobacterium selenitireducens]